MMKMVVVINNNSNNNNNNNIIENTVYHNYRKFITHLRNFRLQHVSIELGNT
jgi:hypothetical protein